MAAPGEVRQAGQDAGHAYGCTCRRAGGHRPADLDVGGVEMSIGGRRFQADVDEFDAAAVASACTGEPPKVTVTAACTAGR